jgi:hypothetical protein
VASHGNAHRTKLADEKVQLGQSASGLKFGALGLGLVALVIAVVVSFFMAGDHATASHAKFYHGYLVGISWCLTIALGGLFFTLMQHMVKVGWSVNIRRVPEALAATLPYLGILTIPLFIPIIGHKGGELYPWAVPHGTTTEHHARATEPLPGAIVDAEGAAAGHVIAESGHAREVEGEGHAPGVQSRYDYMHVDELTEAKAKWLNAPFFITRIIAYFAIWTVIGGYYYAKSKKQDVTGDVEISKHLAIVAPVSIILFALTITFAAFDLIMSLDHHWFSTIFGVYIFAGGMIGMFATTIITFRYLQAKGLVTESVSTEHFHDLGKFLFTFIFFWGYVAFSQFMLQWYANLPEETMWWARRGVTSADALANTQNASGLSFAGLSLVLLFGHFVLPFAYLLSRHIKRSKEALLFGAAWMLLAHLVDMYWLIMPEYNNGEWALDLAIVCAIVGVIGLFVFAFLQTLSGANLRPIGDPRTNESLAFVNM